MAEVRRDRRGGGGAGLSLLYPGRPRPASRPAGTADPLVRQQVEWNVRQETGYRRRAFLVGCRNYLGRSWANLSANPLNDIKDVGSILHKARLAVVLPRNPNILLTLDNVLTGWIWDGEHV